SDARLEATARLLRRRAITEIGPMALAGVHDEKPAGSRRSEHAFGRRHSAAQPRDVIAQLLAETPGIDEITLEVDHEERGGLEIEAERVRFRLDDRHGHFSWHSRASGCDGVLLTLLLWRAWREARARGRPPSVPCRLPGGATLGYRGWDRAPTPLP